MHSPCTCLRHVFSDCLRVCAQASVYRSYKGTHPPPQSSSMYVNVHPKLYWVTSRQAPEQFWVDTATTRAIHAFSNRDTSQYPHQHLLDHGDLAESYRSSYDDKTLPKGCIGKKGAGGDYYPTEEQLFETLLHITAGVYVSCGGSVHMSPGNSMFMHAHLFSRVFC